jgi:hypothetical protein
MADLEPGVQLAPDTIAAMERLSTPPTTEHTVSEQHKATPDMWAALEEMSAPEYDCTILELRARVEALEAAQRVHVEATRPPHQDKLDRLIALDRDDESPASSLVERVGERIDFGINANQDAEGIARAAIREVAAAALQMHPDPNLTLERVALWLEQEAER